jgi:co-chaperonin GroES (HSP10)
MAALAKLKVSRILDQTLDEAFPDIDPQTKPFGSQILVQIKNAATRTQGGLHLTNDTVETEADNTRIAKVRAIGPGAFKNRDTLQPWPEGEWCKVGEFVRIPLYGGDRWRVLVGEREFVDIHRQTVKEKVFVSFALIEDLNLKGLVTGDPLAQLAWIG